DAGTRRLIRSLKVFDCSRAALHPLSVESPPMIARMFRRRRVQIRSEPAPFVESIGATIEAVEEARRGLLSVVPGSRGPGRPPAEGLAAFEWGLLRASELMVGWRSSVAEPVWNECDEAIGEAGRRAERLR